MSDHDTQQDVLRQAVIEIRRLRAQLSAEQQAARCPIAIVGMAARMPGAPTVEDFWQLLEQGGEGIAEIPASRWDIDRYYDPDPEADGTMYTRRAGLLDRIDEFDAAFFGISPREAAALDPQQRLLLEVGWQALEDAAINPESLNGSATGVFYGVTNYDYLQQQMKVQDAGQLEAYSLTSNASTFAAGRTSYWLGLNGPSLSVDTACSSSLVGIHLACQSLRSGECDAALAGGVNVLLVPEWFVVLSRAKMLAPDGRCKTFDEAADGYVRSEGCGVVVLKRLADAERDNDRILAVIRGSAVNQDGRSGGITVPNGRAQQAVARQALAMAGITGDQVDYIETHGTGTPLGDPIELRALNEVFGDRAGGPDLLVGSVKTNVGHLEPAAGVAGLIKVVLALQKGILPPHRNLDRINPAIGIDQMRMRIPVAAEPWPRTDRPRIAGISSFGASGTNAHLLVAEAPLAAEQSHQPEQPDRPVHVLTLSARTPAALRQSVAEHARVLAERPAELADLCFTANTGRARFAERLAAVGDANCLVDALRDYLDDRPSAAHAGRVSPRDQPRVTFLFTGQGSQHPAMARQLYDTEPFFREVLDRFGQLSEDVLDRPLLEILDPAAGEAAPIHQTQYTQPALFAVEFALAQLWMHWGIQPAALIGHSIGELVAACVAGCLSAEDGFRLAAVRGRVMQQLAPEAAMISVSAGAETVAELLSTPAAEALAISGVNGPESVTVAGPTEAVQAAVALFAERGIQSKRVPVDRGFHTSLIEPALAEFERVAGELPFAAPALPIYSNVNGQLLDKITPSYLRAHARSAVQFQAGVQAALADGHRTFLEVGPSGTLTALARMIARHAEVPVTALCSLRPKRDDWSVLLDSAAALWVAGHPVDWAAVDAGRQRRRVSLPGYPFERNRYWFEAGTALERRPAVGGGQPTDRPDQSDRPDRPDQHGRLEPADQAGQRPAGLLGRRLSSPLDVLQYETMLDPQRYDVLADCVIDGMPVVNIGVYLDAVLAASRAANPASAAVLVSDLVVLQALTLTLDRPQPAQLLLSPAAGSGPRRFGYFSAADDGWREHVRGVVQPAADQAGAVAEQALRDWQAVRAGVQPTSGAEFYRALWRRNLFLGPAARWVERLWQAGDGTAVAELRAATPAERAGHLLPPGLTDALFQTLFGCLPAELTNVAYMIVGIDRFVYHDGPPADAATVCRIRLTEVSRDRTTIFADAVLFDTAGRLLVEATGVTLKRAERDQVAKPAAGAALFSLQPAAPAIMPEQQPAAVNRQQVAALVREAVARALGAQPDQLAWDEPLRNLGLDSLMALDAKSTLATQLGVSLPLVTFLEAEDLLALAEEVLGRLGGVRQPAAEPAGGLLLDPAGRHEPFELTDLQQAYLVGRGAGFEFGETSTHFSMEVEVCDLDLARLADCLNALIRRHDMLRAVMTPDGYQRVLPEVPDYQIAVTDLRSLSESDTERRLAEIGRRLSRLVLDAYSWPLFDVRASLVDEHRTRLHFGFDALIIDAWSTMLLLKELAAAYRGEQLPEPLSLTFRDYVQAVRAAESGPDYERAWTYWRDRLDQLPAAPQLPTATVNDQAAAFRHRTMRLSAAEWAQFRKRAAAIGITPSVALCTAYARVLAGWSASSSFTLNLLFFNRLAVHPDIDRVVGNFSATTLLEVHNPAAERFAVSAERVQRQLWQDLEHSQVSGVQVLRELNRRTGQAGRAAMPVVFASTVNFGAREDSSTYTGLSQHLIELGTDGREIASSIRTPQVVLDHQVIEDHGELVLNWDSVDAAFPAGMVDAMFAAYRELVRELATDPQAWQRSAALTVTPAELAVRSTVNDTAADWQSELLHQGFLRQAAQRPEAPAVITDSRCISYRELATAAGQVAGWLIESGIPRGALVGIVMHKGWEQVAAAIGILQAGCAYVPIDAALPAERLATVLGLSGVEAVLTQPDVQPLVEWPPQLRCRVVHAEDLTTPTGGEACREAGVHDLAYVIYTSGSTGVPKGVMIEHAAAVNTIQDVNDTFAVTDEDRVLALSALNFDLSVYDIFGILTAGGAVVLPDPADHREPARWLELVERHRVTIWNSVPALMEMFVETALGRPSRPSSIRRVMMSGDWIPVRLPDRIRELLPAAEVWSLGGATEASIWSIWYRIDRVEPSWTSIPYGRPMRNQRFYVLNADLQPRPDWVPGDLYIAGAGLARGYLGDEAKTRASFIRHPITGERMYRTGDQGRYRPDGVIEFLGRLDSQVKIQGYRIELGEVEAVLENCPGVRSAVAAAVGQRTGAKRLVGYLVAEPGVELDLAAVQRRAAAALPEYEVPQQLIVLDALPLSANGKVDRAALPVAVEAAGRSDGPVRPDGELEEQLCRIWQRFFGERELGVEDNFFDLGGHSLLAVRLMAAIEKETGRSLPLTTLFTHPTVRGLAHSITAEQPADERLLVPMASGSADSDTVLVLIHPVGGEVLCYAELVGLLDAAEPVYALRSPAPDPEWETLPGLAARYVKELQTSLPGRRYRLAGWSMGGVLAIEVGRQLAAAGEQVDRLVLIDLAEPPGPSPDSTEEADLLAWFGRDLAGMAAGQPSPIADELRAHPDGPLPALLEWGRTSGVLAEEIDRAVLEPLYTRFARNLTALLRHRPEPYRDVPAWLFVATDAPAAESVAAAWQALLGDRVTVVPIAGNHFSIMRPPRLAELVAGISGALGHDSGAPSHDSGALGHDQDEQNDRRRPRR